MTSQGDAAPVSRLPRDYHREEVIADAVIHVIGCVLGLAGVIVLMLLAAEADRTVEIVAAGLYGLGLLCMLGFSAAYNMTPPGPARDVLRRFDHAAIFLLIAGTYTPFTLGALTGTWSAVMTAAVWTIAIASAVVKIVFPYRFEKAFLFVYLGLGWIILIAIEPIVAAVDLTTLILIALGGVIYTAGVGFHVWHALKFQNAIWHGFVLVAAAVHWVAVAINV